GQIAGGHFGAFTEIETQLGNFEIPVAETAPDELVNCIRSVIEAVVLERLVHPRCGGPQFANNPSRFYRCIIVSYRYATQQFTMRVDSRLRGPIHVHKDEPRR